MTVYCEGLFNLRSPKDLAVLHVSNKRLCHAIPPHSHPEASEGPCIAFQKRVVKRLNNQPSCYLANGLYKLQGIR